MLNESILDLVILELLHSLCHLWDWLRRNFPRNESFQAVQCVTLTHSSHSFTCPLENEYNISMDNQKLQNIETFAKKLYQKMGQSCIMCQRANRSVAIFTFVCLVIRICQYWTELMCSFPTQSSLAQWAFSPATHAQSLQRRSFLLSSVLFSTKVVPPFSTSS